MLAFIAQYWLQFLLGVIATGLSIACKKIYKLYKNEKEGQKTKEQKELQESMEKLIKQGQDERREAEEAIQKQIDTLTQGVLNIQKRHFMQQCRELMDEEHEITLKEFETTLEDHSIYNALGGNHDGDLLFEMVQKKATSNLTDKQQKTKNRES